MIIAPGPQYWKARQRLTLHERILALPPEVCEFAHKVNLASGLDVVPVPAVVTPTMRRELGEAICGMPAGVLEPIEPLLLGVCPGHGLGSARHHRHRRRRRGPHPGRAGKRISPSCLTATIRSRRRSPHPHATPAPAPCNTFCCMNSRDQSLRRFRGMFRELCAPRNAGPAAGWKGFGRVRAAG